MCVCVCVGVHRSSEHTHHIFVSFTWKPGATTSYTSLSTCVGVLKTVYIQLYILQAECVCVWR